MSFDVERRRRARQTPLTHHCGQYERRLTPDSHSPTLSVVRRRFPGVHEPDHGTARTGPLPRAP